MLPNDEVGDHPLRRRRAESRPGNGCLHCPVERRLLRPGPQALDQGTHNTAEWEALKLGLRLALKHGERHVVVKGDSTLVVKQVNREWKTKSPTLRSLRTEAEDLLAQFESWRVEWIPRKENWRADELGRAK
jgi:ribonuclease HI